MSNNSYQDMESSISPSSELAVPRVESDFLYWINFWVIKMFMN